MCEKLCRAYRSNKKLTRSTRNGSLFCNSSFKTPSVSSTAELGWHWPAAGSGYEADVRVLPARPETKARRREQSPPHVCQNEDLEKEFLSKPDRRHFPLQADRLGRLGRFTNGCGVLTSPSGEFALREQRQAILEPRIGNACLNIASITAISRCNDSGL